MLLLTAEVDHDVFVAVDVAAVDLPPSVSLVYYCQLVDDLVKLREVCLFILLGVHLEVL